MAQRKITVALPDDAIDKLHELGRRELREPRIQAAYLILAGLRAAGLDPEPAEPRRPEPSR